MILNIIDFLKTHKWLSIIVVVLLLIIIVSGIWYIKSKKTNKKISTTEVATIGVFTAFSIVLYFIKFNLPIFPSFLEINFSLLPIIIIGFMLGPTEGVILVLLRGIIKMPFTSTFCVGELADILIGIPVVLATSLIYQKHHSRKGAIIALITGFFTWILAGVISNYLINVPAFILMYCNGNVESFVAGVSVIPGITKDNYMIKYILYAAIPFNGLIALVVNTITFLVYKKISILFNKISNKNIA